MSRSTREKKRLERLAAEKAAAKPWEYEALRWILKTVVALVFTSYVLIGAWITWSWVATKWVRLQPIEEVVRVADKNLSSPTGDPENLRSWISLRPPSDGEAIIKLLEPYIGRMSGMTFLIYAQWLAQEGKLEEAAFWRQYARFRIRFDAIRCGSFDATKLMAKMMDQLPQAEIKAYMEQHPAALPGTLRKVLAFDARHLPVNNPTQFCKALVAMEEQRNEVKIEMRPPSEWVSMHDVLVYTTLVDILHLEKVARERQDEQKPAETPAPPAPKKKHKR